MELALGCLADRGLAWLNSLLCRAGGSTADSMIGALGLTARVILRPPADLSTSTVWLHWCSGGGGNPSKPASRPASAFTGSLVRSGQVVRPEDSSSVACHHGNGAPLDCHSVSRRSPVTAETCDPISRRSFCMDGPQEPLVLKATGSKRKRRLSAEYFQRFPLLHLKHLQQLPWL